MSTNQRARIHSIGLVLSLLLLTGTFSSSVFAVDNPCDPGFTSVDANGDFLVSPSMDATGVTDTTNLQCVNNAIENQSFHALRLANGSFYIKDIYLNCPSSKECTFAGTSKAGTILNVVDDSVDCKSNDDNYMLVGGLNFRGNITVQYLTVRGNSPCMADSLFPGLIVFTGEPAVMDETCGNSVLFGALNRVNVETSNWEIDAGVVVAPQGRYFGGPTCPDGLSGSFTSTRTNVDGPYIGLLLSMQAGARVGVDFFENSNSASGVLVFDSNAITAVNFCDITGEPVPGIDFWGVGIIRSAGAPTTNTTNVNKCTFNINNPHADTYALGVNVQDWAPPSNMPTVVSASTFNLMGNESFGVEFGNIPNCTVTGNRFTGSAGNAIALFTFDGGPLSGCTVTANTGLSSLGTFYDDIYGGPGTFDNVLGLHPGALVIDDGCNFDLNVADGGCALGGIIIQDDQSAKPLVSSATRPSSRSFLQAEPGDTITHWRDLMGRRTTNR